MALMGQSILGGIPYSRSKLILFVLVLVLVLVLALYNQDFIEDEHEYKDDDESRNL